MSIVVIGSINTDLVIQVPRFAKESETVLGFGGYKILQGGKGANQAVAVAATGSSVKMVGKVGNDDFGKRAVENLIAAGVDCEFVSQSQEFSTGLATIFLDPQAQNSITVAPGANAELSVTDVYAAKDAIINADIIMMQLEIPIETCKAAAKLANDNGVIVILDPAPAPDHPLEFLNLVDYLTPNELEAYALTGIQAIGNEKLVSETLLEMGVKQVAMTLGSHGSYIASKTLSRAIQSTKVEVVDSSGAGDAFNGFFASALSKGLNFQEAAEIASTAATTSVTHSGARITDLNWDDVLSPSK